MLFLHQLKVLLWKNFILKKRSPFVLLFELVIPLVLFLVMTAIRKTQQTSFHLQTNYTPNFLDYNYRAKPFPSTGFFSVLQSFCPKTVPSNEQGFNVFPNGTSTEILITIDRISRTNPFFTQNFSMFDIDSLPEMYETMIDRPAILYDRFENFSSIFTRNLSMYCSFLTVQLNLTIQQCEEILNNSHIDYSQRRSRRDLTISTLIPNLFPTVKNRTKRDIFTDEPTLFDYYLLLQDKFSPIELLQTTMLMTKIIEKKSFENLTETEMKLLAKILRTIVFHPKTLQEIFCSAEKFDSLFQLNSTSTNITDFRERLCQMNDEQYQNLSKILSDAISDDQLIDFFQLEHIELSSILFQLNDYYDKVEKYALFERGLTDIYQLAKILRTNSCYIQETNQTDPSSRPQSAEALSGNVESVAMDKLKRKKKAFSHFGSACKKLFVE